MSINVNLDLIYDFWFLCNVLYKACCLWFTASTICNIRSQKTNKPRSHFMQKPRTSPQASLQITFSYKPNMSAQTQHWPVKTSNLLDKCLISGANLQACSRQYVYTLLYGELRGFNRN